MEWTALVLAPVACGVVLAVSGFAKLRRPDLTEEALVALDVPRLLRRPFVTAVLPWVELVIGAALLLTWGWLLVVVGALAVVLLAAYTVLIARVVAAGKEADCACFGALTRAAVGPATLVRNVALLLLAVLAVLLGARGSGVIESLGDFADDDWLWLAMAALVAATAVLVVGLPSGHEETDVAIDDEELEDYLRQPIPFGILETAEGERLSLHQLVTTQAVLLVFLNHTCSSCLQVAYDLPRIVRELGPTVAVRPVYQTPDGAIPDELRDPGITLLFDRADQMQRLFGLGGRPSAVLLGADGELAGGPVNGPDDVLSFCADIAAELGEVHE